MRHTTDSRALEVLQTQGGNELAWARARIAALEAELREARAVAARLATWAAAANDGT